MIFKYSSQEFDNSVLDLIKQKGFYAYECMSDFEKFKEELRSKENFYSFLTGKKIGEKEYEHVLKVWNKFEMKTMNDYHNLYLKCDVLLLLDVFQKFTLHKKCSFSTRLSSVNVTKSAGSCGFYHI